MKKIICLILCVALSALVLVSCGDEEHVHQYNRDQWTSDATNHWHAADCGCEGVAPIDVAKHVDVEMDDGRCDICGAVCCAETAYKTTYTVNPFSHWFESKCEHNGQNSHLPVSVVAHNYVNGVCSVCAYDCVANGHVDTEKDADGVVKGNGTCDACKIVYCDGNYSDQLTSNETGHWYAAGCDAHVHAQKDFEEHIDIAGALDENEQVIGDGLCDACQFELAENE